MGYHSDFWVAAAAVAPVLAVANTVALGQAMDGLLARRRAEVEPNRVPGRRRWGRRERAHLARFYWQSVLGVVLDLVAMLLALSSLADGSDFVPPSVEVVALGLALLLVLTQTFASAEAKLAALQAEVDNCHPRTQK